VLDLHRWIRTNLRTMLMTWVWAFIVCLPCRAQPTFCCSVTGRDVLSESEALSSPLADLGDAVEVVAMPRPFSLEGLSQARLVAPLHLISMAVALDARGSAALMQVAPSARLRWVPAEGYAMGLAAGLDWMSIRGFDDMIAARLDVHAGMTMAEWTVAAGIDGMIEMGAARGPVFRMGLAADLDSHAITAELRLPWNRPASLRIAGRARLVAGADVRLGLCSDPLSIDCALRTGISPSADLLLDIRSVWPLGLRTTLTLAFAVPW
jgi:hypothetical protein